MSPFFFSRGASLLFLALMRGSLSLVPSSVLRREGHHLLAASSSGEAVVTSSSTEAVVAPITQPGDDDDDEEETVAAASGEKEEELKKKKKKKRKKKKSVGGGRRSQAAKKGPQMGKSANVAWRALPMRVVRGHPLFRGLPPASRVCSLPPSLAQAALFRQEDWRWDALHAGRLTGSRIAAVLGFFESDAARILNVPRSLSTHARAVSAARHLAAGVVLCDPDELFQGSSDDDDDDDDESDEAAWSTDGFHTPVAQTQRKPKYASADAQTARLAWGTVQEGVGVVAAVDYAATAFPTSFVAECGMLAAESASLASLAREWARHEPSPALLKLAETPAPDAGDVADGGLAFGASPDGLLIHADGTIDVLEVKSVSPFVQHNNEMMAIRDRGPHESVGAWHVPQVMLEIFCAGPACRGALLVSVSATKGAIFKYLVRDDAYIAEMLRYARTFHERYATGFEAPPPCFNADDPLYDDFLRRTAEIAAAAELRAVVPDVQRAPPRAEPFFYQTS